MTESYETDHARTHDSLQNTHNTYQAMSPQGEVKYVFDYRSPRHRVHKKWKKTILPVWWEGMGCWCIVPFDFWNWQGGQQLNWEDTESRWKGVRFDVSCLSYFELDSREPICPETSLSWLSCPRLLSCREWYGLSQLLGMLDQGHYWWKKCVCVSWPEIRDVGNRLHVLQQKRWSPCFFLGVPHVRLRISCSHVMKVGWIIFKALTNACRSHPQRTRITPQSSTSC